MLDKFDEGEDDMHAILRTVYYFSKMSCVLFNEHETVWTRDLLVMFCLMSMRQCGLVTYW